jgi:hypothetical protein
MAWEIWCTLKEFAMDTKDLVASFEDCTWFETIYFNFVLVTFSLSGDLALLLQRVCAPMRMRVFQGGLARYALQSFFVSSHFPYLRHSSNMPNSF